jgi:hypothetical protein
MYPGGKIRMIKPKHEEFCALFRMNLAHCLACNCPVHTKNHTVHTAKVARNSVIADSVRDMAESSNIANS